MSSELTNQIITMADEKPNQTETATLSRRTERIIAFNLLYAWDRYDYTVELDEVIEGFTQGFDTPIVKDSFAIMVVTGTAAQRDELDEQIKPFLKSWKLERLGCCTRLILRMALWELGQPDSIPTIAINEAVELAKTFAEKDAYKFVNGILDEICRHRYGEIKTDHQNVSNQSDEEEES